MIFWKIIDTYLAAITAMTFLKVDDGHDLSINNGIQI
jgi:hypothetical protein